MNDYKHKSIQGLFLLVDRRKEKGLIRWLNYLSENDMPALVMADGATVENQPELIKEIVKRNFDVGVSYNEGALWPETHDDMLAWLPEWIKVENPYSKSHYEIQKIIMHHINDKLFPLLGKTMPVFSGKYFSYDDDTLKIADEMGISYILARGTQKERAVFYQPEEYQPTIISVSNVPSKELGTGSLCDESLETRNETPQDFKKVLDNLDVDRVILVAQTHVSGLEDDWWDVYEDFFKSGRVNWQTLSDFVVEPKHMPNAKIPVNKEVDYRAIHLSQAKIAGRMV